MSHYFMGTHHRLSSGDQWVSRPGAQRWLGRWQSDGTLDKILTTLILIDGNGSPIAFTSTVANGDERQQVEPLLNRVEKHRGGVLAKGIIPILEADQGYDAEPLRDNLLKRKIFPWICRRKKPGKEAEKVESILKRIRWKVERAISWLQRKFRRLAVRWEKKRATGRDF